MPKLGKNEKRILQILTKNPNVDVKQMCRLLYGQEVKLRSSKYNSMARSLVNLQLKGLIEKGGWKVVVESYEPLPEPLPEHLKKMSIGVRYMEKEDIRDDIHEGLKAFNNAMRKLINLL